MDFGEKITALRKEQGLSQMKLAAAIGKSQAYLSSIESGDRFVSQEVLQQLIDGLGIGSESPQTEDLISHWLEDCGLVIFETCPLRVEQRDLLLSIQEKLESLDSEQCKTIKKILNSDG